MKVLSKQDVCDILLGCTVLGTGGGGSLDKGLELVEKAFEAGKQFKLASMDEIADDEWIGIPYMCGALTPQSEEDPLGHLEVMKEPSPLLALKAMEKYIGKEFYGVMSTELGGGNTAEAFYAAAMLDKVIVDADPAGRSVPELQHSTFYIYDIPIYPLAVADAYGDTVIVSKAINDARAEDLVRAMAVVSNNSVGVVDHPATASIMRGKVIDGAISDSLKIGRALREAAEKGSDIAEAIVNAGSGKILFKGIVSEMNWESKQGFTLGDVYIKNKSDEYKVWFKNENIISWLNGEIHATVPDLICIVDNRTNMPLQNPFINVGMDVTVFALPAPKVWTTPKGLEVFGPKHFGFDIDYIPIV